MIVYLTQVVDRLLAAGLKLKAWKCSLFSSKSEYLGHIVSQQGIATKPDKIRVVQNWEVPTNVTELRSIFRILQLLQEIWGKL